MSGRVEASQALHSHSSRSSSRDSTNKSKRIKAKSIHEHKPRSYRYFHYHSRLGQSLARVKTSSRRFPCIHRFNRAFYARHELRKKYLREMPLDEITIYYRCRSFRQYTSRSILSEFIHKQKLTSSRYREQAVAIRVSVVTLSSSAPTLATSQLVVQQLNLRREISISAFLESQPTTLSVRARFGVLCHRSIVFFFINFYVAGRESMRNVLRSLPKESFLFSLAFIDLLRNEPSMYVHIASNMLAY